MSLLGGNWQLAAHSWKHHRPLPTLPGPPHLPAPEPPPLPLGAAQNPEANVCCCACARERPAAPPRTVLAASVHFHRVLSLRGLGPARPRAPASEAESSASGRPAITAWLPPGPRARASPRRAVSRARPAPLAAGGASATLGIGNSGLGPAGGGSGGDRRITFSLDSPPKRPGLSPKGTASRHSGPGTEPHLVVSALVGGFRRRVR